MLLALGSVANTARVLGIHKPVAYKIKDGIVPEQHIPQLIKGFDRAEKNLAKFKKQVLG